MNLTQDQRDVLTELINIGFSRTAASLSELTGHRVLVEVPEVSMHPIQELSPALRRFIPGEMATVHQVFTGTVSGDALLLLNHEGAALLTDLLTSQSPRTGVARLDESAREVLAEVGNILLNACLGTFGNLLEVQISFSVPRVELEALDSMMRSLVIGRDELQYALVVRTRFRLRDSAVQGYLVIVLGVSSMDRLMQALERMSAGANAPGKGGAK
jgi:chemotaxis protein CheC